MAETNFQWKSWLGLSVGLFLLYGIANILLAIWVPYTLHTQGAGAMGGLVISNSADEKVAGVSLETLPKTNPRLNDFFVAFMDTMCMMMVAFGILQVAIVWYALRARQHWALWALALADLSFIPYWMAVGNLYSKYGVPSGEIWGAFGSFFIILIVAVIVATYAGWLDLKKASA